MILPKTSRSLNQLRTTLNLSSGTHRSNESRPALSGQVVDRVNYDVSKHTPDQIDPVRRSFIGLPQVKIRKPKSSLPINVLVYGGVQPALNEKWRPLRDSREKLTTNLANSMIEAIGYRNLGQVVLMGTALDLAVRNPKPLIGPNEPSQVASAIESITSEGSFSIVISDDFQTLLFNGLAKVRPKSSMAIILSHPIDRKLPSGSGIMSLGGYREVDTNNPVELADFNLYLEAQHQRLVRGLKDIGILSGSVDYDANQAQGFNTSLADNNISTAIMQITTNRR